MRAALNLLLGVALVFVVNATQADEKKEVTLKGTIVCSKCELGETKACGNAIKTKIDDKDVIVYFDDKGGKEDYHKTCCKANVKGSVTGVLSEKDKKKFITPSKNGVKFDEKKE